MNEIYKHIWMKEFGLDVSHFIDFDGDPFDSLRLPVPSFVLKSLLQYAKDINWHVGDEFVCQQSYNYDQKIRHCLKFYEANQEILAWNEGNYKLKIAKNFLREVGVLEERG